MNDNQKCHSLHVRLLLTVAAVMTFFMAISAYWTVYNDQQKALQRLNSHGVMIASMQAKALARPLWDLNTDNLKAVLEAYSTDIDFRYSKVTDNKGRVLASTGTPVVRSSDLQFERDIVFDFNDVQEVLGKVSLVLSQDNLFAQIRKELVQDLSAFVLLLLATMASMYMALLYIVIKPVENITQKFEHMEGGDLKQRITIKKMDELGRMAAAFNRMTKKLQDTYETIEGNAKLLEIKNQKLETATAQAKQANSIKSQFLANMGHELRTPLNAIIGYSSLLSEAGKEMQIDDMLADIAKIHTSASHLLGLINDILDISKIESGKVELLPEKFLLQDTIDDISAIMTPILLKGNNSLEVDIDESLDYVYTDEGKLRQNLLNLMSNAAKFTENGKVTVRVKHSVINDNSYMDIAVLDTGIGMSEEQLQRIFDPFTQADAATTRKYGGTGLGLAITQKTCELLGGHISVESHPGQGSVFTMHLPTHLNRIKKQQQIL